MLYKFVSSFHSETFAEEAIKRGIMYENVKIQSIYADARCFELLVIDELITIRRTRSSITLKSEF